MTFDKSLKLLNYATVLNGFLQLYTELDNSYAVGDTLYVVGGFYDNAQDLMYVSSYNVSFPTAHNPFNSFRTGYTVTDVNRANNSFTINYPVSGVLYYPYGVAGNPFGSPQDSTHLAYNTYTGPSLYKGVYVSRAVFTSGRFRSGTINNGVFGTDNSLVRLNIHESQVGTGYALQSDLNINHIVSKNVSVSKGSIVSKTDGAGQSTVKMTLVEDSTLGVTPGLTPGDNPFVVINTGAGSNNDSYGYSAFEKFVNYGAMSISNGVFNSPVAGNISLSGLTIGRAKIGDKEPIGAGANVLSSCNLLSGFLGNFTNTVVSGGITQFGNNATGGGTVDSFIDLGVGSGATFTLTQSSGAIATAVVTAGGVGYMPSTTYSLVVAGGTGGAVTATTNTSGSFVFATVVTSGTGYSSPTATLTTVLYNSTSGQMTFDVNYSAVANRQFATGVAVYISGITPKNVTPSGDAIFEICNSFGVINGVTYTFGSVTSAQVTITFNSLVSIWSSWKTAYPPTDFDFSKMKITYAVNTNMLVNGKSTVSGVFNTNFYIDGSYGNVVTLAEGHLDTGVVHASVNASGSSYGESVYMTNVKQMYQDVVKPTATPAYSYVNLISMATPVKANFINSTVADSVVHNSNLSTCYVYPVSKSVYLYNAFISGNSIIDPAVYWDDIQFNGTPDAVVPYNPVGPVSASIRVNSSMKDRKTPWKTAPVALAPLSAASVSVEYNKTEGMHAGNVYNSQSLVRPTTGTFAIPNQTIRYHVPTQKQVQPSFDDTKFMSIVNHGDMVFLGFLWTDDPSKLRNDVLFADVLVNNVTLVNKISNRTSNTTSSVDSDFTGLYPVPVYPASPPFIGTIRGVDGNFVYTDVNHYNSTKSRGQSDISINVYQSPPVPSGQPDPSYSLALVSFLKVDNGSHPVDHITPSSTTTLGTAPFTQGDYNIIFRNNGPSVAGPALATSAPACFIEVERVIIEYYDLSGSIVDIEINVCNYCPPVPGHATGGAEYSWDTLVPGSAYPTLFSILYPPYNPGADGVVMTWDSTLYSQIVVNVEYWVTWYSTSAAGIALDNTNVGYNITGQRDKRIDVYTFN